MSIVGDTGPLVALAKIDGLGLLAPLFGEVLITPTVHRELMAKVGQDVARLDVAMGDSIRVVHVPVIAMEVQESVRRLGAGEIQAIAVAYDSGLLLLLDDQSARVVALRLGVKVTGTAGVLIRAKQAGLIPAVRPLLERMRQS